jgi:hypothetical protein
VLGDPKAKVSVIEFGDLQCPVCKEFSFQVAPDIISQIVRKGDANYEFRPGTSSARSRRTPPGRLRRGRAGPRLELLELFYRNQGEENSGHVTDSFLTSIAQGAGVGTSTSGTATAPTTQWDPLLSTNDSDAKSLGFTGTPSISSRAPAEEALHDHPYRLPDRGGREVRLLGARPPPPAPLPRRARRPTRRRPGRALACGADSVIDSACH